LVKKDPFALIKRIYEYIENNPQKNVTEISKELNIHRTTVSKYLNLLLWLRNTNPVYEIRGSRGARNFYTKKIRTMKARQKLDVTIEYTKIIMPLMSQYTITMTYGLLACVSQKGSLAKGVNETTKACVEKKAKFVVLSIDVKPIEVIMHLPLLCKARNIPFSYVPSCELLGRVIGCEVRVAACAIIDPGEFEDIMHELICEVEDLKSRFKAMW
jgi:large subunit ribosomal protein L7Ae